MVERHAYQRLSLANVGKTYAGKPRSEPDPGKPAVRDRRGASGTVAKGAGGGPWRKPAEKSMRARNLSRPPECEPDVRGGERLGHFGGPFWATPFPLARGSQNGPRPQGFASPRNNGAPLTAAGRSERTPRSKRERVRAESYQTAALLAPFSTAIDKPERRRFATMHSDLR
jgi:hypothetical protein